MCGLRGAGQGSRGEYASPSSVLSLPTLPSPATFPLVLVGVALFALVAPLVGGGAWIEDVGYE